MIAQSTSQNEELQRKRTKNHITREAEKSGRYEARWSKEYSLIILDNIDYFFSSFT